MQVSHPVIKTDSNDSAVTINLMYAFVKEVLKKDL